MPVLPVTFVAVSIVAVVVTSLALLGRVDPAETASVAVAGRTPAAALAVTGAPSARAPPESDLTRGLGNLTTAARLDRYRRMQPDAPGVEQLRG